MTHTQPSPQPFGPAFWRTVMAFIAVLLILELAQGMSDRWFRWYASPERNPAFAEGFVWWYGRLDLPVRMWDSALYEGHVYNVYPPLLSIIGFLATAPLPGRDDPGYWPEFLPLLLFGLPVPFIVFGVFHRRTGSTFWTAVLTLAWLGGTAVLPCLRLGRDGDVYHLNHLLSQSALLILTAELLGRRRLRILLPALVVTAWTRQLTVFYAAALLAAEWRGRQRVPARSSDVPAARPPPGSRSPGRLAACLGTLVVTAAVPMGLNWAKFGSPLRSGYEWVYAERTDGFAEDVRAHGVFSTAYLARNAYYMNAAVPAVEWYGGRRSLVLSTKGTCLWLTTPLAALLLAGGLARRRDRVRRDLLLCSAPIIAALLCYHTTGESQPGYWRFALDFLPAWFVLAADWAVTGWRRWATLACTIWSLAYFALLLG